MPDRVVSSSKLTAIANAIRAKAGTQNSMTLDEMPTAIANIPSGGSGYTVAILTDNYITHTGGALTQTNLSGPMTSVTLSPTETYRINQPSGGSGITVTANGNNYVISGTPTADVTITCTTTRNADLLTSTQKDVSTWVADHPSATYGYIQTVSGKRIDWKVTAGSGSGIVRNTAYTTELPLTQIPAGNYMFEIRYRITDLSQLDDDCRVGITTTYGYSANNDFLCLVPILGTQTSYTTVSVPYTRDATHNAYLAISNTYWNSSSTSRQGRIYLDSISLREA